MNAAKEVCHFRCTACAAIHELDAEMGRIRRPGEVGYRLVHDLPSTCCPSHRMEWVSMVRFGPDLVPWDEAKAAAAVAEETAKGFRLATDREWYGRRTPVTDYHELARFIRHLRQQWGLPVDPRC